MDWKIHIRRQSAGSLHLAGVAHDVLYGLRRVRRQPGAALLTTITVAVGVAAVTVLFSVVHGVLLKPLPWPDADRFVRLYETRQGSTRRLPPLMTNVTYREWREQPATIESLAAWSTRTLTLGGTGATERIRAAAVTASLFDLLQAGPLLGQVFGPDAEREDADQVVISHGLWQQRFGGDPSIVGSGIQLDGLTRRVVAVMPASFVFPEESTRVWVPLDIPPVTTPGTEGWTVRLFSAMARLKPGTTPEQASAEGTARGRAGPDSGPVKMAVFGSDGPLEVTAVPALEAQTREVRPGLLILLVAVGLLLVTATANIASMQLARAVARRREVAIRAAIGADAGQLTRQLLIENCTLGLAGGIAGLLLAVWVHRLLPRLLTNDFPRISDITMDWRMAAFAIGVSLVTSVVFGLLPVLYARRIDVSSALAEDGLAPAGSRMRSATGRARALIMAGQVAVVCVLLVGAALLTRSFAALLQTDRGYDPHNVLTARVVMPDHAFSPARRAAVLGDLLTRLRTAPGVSQAGMTTSLPLTTGEMLASFPMRSPKGDGTITVQTGVRHVSPGYFAAMGMRLVEGRDFRETDTVDSPGVAVVNQAFARTYLSETPLQDRVPSRVGRSDAGAGVIGVLEDVRSRPMAEAAQPELYLSIHQVPTGLQFDEPLVAIRTDGDPLRLATTLRALAQEQDPEMAVESVMAMEDRLLDALARPRLYALLLGGFAALALLIAGVGLFAVLAYGVAQRVREIGVRTALGARPRDVVALVVRQALAITAVGAGAGLLLSLFAARALSTTLYGIAPHDAASFFGTAAVLAIVAALACAIPARRAARIDPLRALRGER